MKLPAFQRRNLITKLRGLLELEIPRMGIHFFFKLLDGSLEFLCGQRARDRGGFKGGAASVSARSGFVIRVNSYAINNVIHGLDD